MDNATLPHDFSAEARHGRALGGSQVGTGRRGGREGEGGGRGAAAAGEGGGGAGAGGGGGGGTLVVVDKNYPPMHDIENEEKQGRGEKAVGGHRGNAQQMSARRLAGKGLAGVENLHAAFGIRAGSDSSEGEAEEYMVRGNTGVMEKVKRKPTRGSAGGGRGTGTGRSNKDQDAPKDLAEAAKTIIKPLFGDNSRAVGRQAGGKVLPPATGSRRNLAVHARKGSVVNRLSLAGAGGDGGSGGGGIGAAARTRVPPAGAGKGSGTSEEGGGGGGRGGGGDGGDGVGDRVGGGGVGADGGSGSDDGNVTGSDFSGVSPYLTVGGYFKASNKERGQGKI